MDYPTPEIIEAFKRLLETGMTRVAAAQYLGISKIILSRWFERAVLEPHSIFGDFRLSVHIAEANLEQKLISTIVDAGSSDWKAATWVLQSHPIYGQRWGKGKENSKVQTASTGNSVQIYIPDNNRESDGVSCKSGDGVTEDMFSEAELVDNE